MLKGINIRLKRTTGYKVINIVAIDERGRAKTVILRKK